MSDHGYPHEITGVETRKLGMWVFLSTEILFFGTLITTYLIFKGRSFDGMRLEDVYDIPFTSVSSFVLLMSSLTMVLAHNAIEKSLSEGEMYNKEWWEHVMDDNNDDDRAERFEVLEFWGTLDKSLLEQVVRYNEDIHRKITILRYKYDYYSYWNIKKTKSSQ